MKFQVKYKICLWKSYLEKGMSILNYAKYLVMFFALASNSVLWTFVFAAVFGISSFFLGWWWFRSEFMKAEFEVSNNYNLFVRQMRKSIRCSENRKV